MSKVLSVAIPSYNAEKYLEQDIPFFLREDLLEDLEVLIVNDGSKDGTREVGERFAAQYPSCVKVVNKENGGHGSAINAGLCKASGTYFKVVDADDWINPDAMKALIEFLKETDMDLVLNPFHIVCDTDGSTECNFPLEEDKWQQIVYGQTYEMEKLLPDLQDVLQMHSITYRTELLKEHEIRIDEKMFYVDQEYVIYPVPYIRNVAFLPGVVYQYRVATAEQSMNWKNLIKNRDMHGTVLKCLIAYYENIKENLTDVQRQFFLYRCAKMLNTQANIYFMMEQTGQAKAEMIRYEKSVREADAEIYEFPYSRKADILRKMNYTGFGLVSRYTKKKWGR